METLRIKNDVNGNGRMVVHFMAFLTHEDSGLTLNQKYSIAHKRALAIGGRKYTGKDFGGGFVFQAQGEWEILEAMKRQGIPYIELEPKPRECGSLTMLEFDEPDFDKAKAIAKREGYRDNYAYSTTSALNGLHLLPFSERPNAPSKCIIKTLEFGLCIVEPLELD